MWNNVFSTVHKQCTTPSAEGVIGEVGVGYVDVHLNNI